MDLEVDSKLQQITSTLQARAGSRVNVILESNFPGKRIAGGKYNMGTDTITMYIDEIKRQCKMLFKSLEYFYEYFTVVFAHELGHAEDQELEGLADRMDTAEDFERKQIALRIEENAWCIAKELIPDLDSNFIHEIIEESLLYYRDQVKTETVSVPACIIP
ncbi:hypothetical protein D3H55_23515 [Bacillus salacetis]|uniref:ImmA/IrrE family metallo-endopeptidase n=1 Tax=Bacillus salacetis TaxID=2315464 RepID=A0A3A1QKZ8_9BACI|nr:hypothetical protein [Bacillus salacetis]RIW26734.1 hypothetical protein D3H55_23515 [Bacillus salacetis]